MMTEENNVVVQPVDKAKIKQIVKVAVILGIITSFEFAIAFTIGAGTVKTSIFVIMTLVKAFYIIWEFMHLGHEVKGLKWMIIAPTLFVIWLLVALLMEGTAIHNALF
ncbi:MAG: cytochrome C oxidase subunit IV family protein [Cyclobacteriaceae bacterium]|nr:cytochrome C oxidase subunit IV family protein [Cyclobacteriaceae bacterium]